VTVEIARIRRVLAAGGPVDLSDLSRTSDALRFLLATETGEGLQNNPLRAYSELAQGHFEKALEIGGVSDDAKARLLRLVAASDGAAPALIEQALALPPDRGIDSGTAWVAVGLAARRKAALPPYLDQLKQIESHDAEKLLRFVDLLRSGGDKSVAEKSIDGLMPEARGKAYGIGIILLGKDAPPKWREKVKLLLFASERPYFS
jgi:hypothetical protein